MAAILILPRRNIAIVITGGENKKGVAGGGEPCVTVAKEMEAAVGYEVRVLSVRSVVNFLLYNRVVRSAPGNGAYQVYG